MTVAIIDYGSGNLHSVAKAFERMAAEGETSTQILVTSDPGAVRGAGRIVLPGVGAFADCMRGLRGVPGMVDALAERVIRQGAPFLGICVGMQLMASRGLEHGQHDGLAWIAGEVTAIEPGDPALKIPHMGWNLLDLVAPHPVLEGLAALGGPDGPHAYFVHSYHFVPDSADAVLARVTHGAPVTAAVGRDNLIGVQFHPEKSQAVGLALIANFLRWRP